MKSTTVVVTHLGEGLDLSAVTSSPLLGEETKRAVTGGFVLCAYGKWRHPGMYLAMHEPYGDYSCQCQMLLSPQTIILTSFCRGS